MTGSFAVSEFCDPGPDSNSNAAHNKPCFPIIQAISSVCDGFFRLSAGRIEKGRTDPNATHK